MAEAPSITTVIRALERLLPGIPVKDGGEHLAAHEAPPRIVFVPGAETWGPPNPKWVGKPRCLKLREVTLTAHVWGTDRDQIEKSLLPRLVLALDGALQKSYRLTQGMWPQEDSETLMQSGRVYVLPITVFLPLVVPAGIDGEATITATDTTDTTVETP